MPLLLVLTGLCTLAAISAAWRSFMAGSATDSPSFHRHTMGLVAFRCLIEDDAAGRELAPTTLTSV